MTPVISINGSVEKAGYRRAHYIYQAREVRPGMFNVSVTSDYVPREYWTDIPFDRLFLDINNHLMQYAKKMAEGDY